jgi:uncharacterized protein
MEYHFTSAIRQSFIRLSSPAKLLFLLLLVFVFLIISSILAVFLAIPVFNLSLAEIMRIISMPDEKNIGILKFFQIIQSVFLFLVPALIAAWLYSEDMSDYLKARTKPGAMTLFIVICSMVVAIPLLNVVALLNSEMVLPPWMHSVEVKIKTMEESAGRLTGLFLSGGGEATLAVNLLMIGILPAIGEEFLFRGLIQRLLIEWTKNRHVGIWIAAFLFSFIHFQFYGFIPRFLLGLYFGYLLVWSSSIWVPVTGHFINNGFAVFYYHFASKPMGETEMDKLGTQSANHYALYLSIILTSVLLTIIFLNEKGKKELIR